MKKNRQSLLAKLHILLKETGAENEKESIYASYNVGSAREMTDEQIIDLIRRLEGTCAAPKVDLKALRSDILFILTANPEAQNRRRRGLGIPNDWQYLNPFILNHAGKRLPDMNEGELTEFKKKLYAIRDSGWRYEKKQEHQRPVIVVGVPSNNVIN